MTEVIYAQPYFTKKIRFQTGVKEERNTDVSDDIDNARIYDNYCAEESTPPDKSQDNTTEDQQQTAPVDVSSEKRNVFGAAAVLLGLLCLLLLVAVIVLVVLFTLERNENANLTSEREELKTSYIEMKGLHHNLTLKTDQLKNEKDHLKATNDNLTTERDELEKRLNETTCCPNKWIRFGDSCYFKSTTQSTWNDSNDVCKNDDAHLVVISSEEEQDFISWFNRRAETWIGLTDEEHEGVWKWVDGTALSEKYWGRKQPDNYKDMEDCVVISGNNWNDLSCSKDRHFICEKVLK